MMAIRGEGTIKRVLPNGDPCPHGRTKCKCKYRLQYQDEHGKQREKRFEFKADAESFKTAVNHQKRAAGAVPGYLKGDSPMFDTYATGWLASRTKLKDNSRRRYETLLRLYVMPWFKGKKIGRIPEDDVERFTASLYARGMHPGDVRDAVSSVLGGIMRKAVEENYLFKDPTRKIEFQEVRYAERYVPTRDEVRLLMELIKEKFRLGVVLGSLCGLREGEILGSTLDCVREDRFRVYRQWSKDASWEPLKHRKEGEFREVPLPPFVREEIERHVAAGLSSPDGILFPSPVRPTPISHTRFLLELGAARLRLGNEEIKPHGLRSFYATECLINGVDIATVSKWLGHRNIQTTFDHYHWLIPEAWDKGSGVIDGILRAA